MRVVGIFAMTVGLAIWVGVLPLFLYQSRIQRQEQVELERLQADVRAWGDSVAAAESGADSALAYQRLAGRREAVTRQAYHLADRAQTLDRWWWPYGTGGMAAIAGLALFVIGAFVLRRALTAPWNLPPLDDRYRSQG